jgi:hypothetical protein
MILLLFLLSLVRRLYGRIRQCRVNSVPLAIAPLEEQRTCQTNAQGRSELATPWEIVFSVWRRVSLRSGYPGTDVCFGDEKTSREAILAGWRAGNDSFLARFDILRLALRMGIALARFATK